MQPEEYHRVLLGKGRVARNGGASATEDSSNVAAQVTKIILAIFQVLFASDFYTVYWFRIMST